MNPDTNDKPTANPLSRLLRLFQKREAQHAAKSRRATSHQQRGAAELKKRRRKIANASRRDQRRRAQGK